MNEPSAVVVVRASGERTAAACERILARDADGMPIHVVNEHPFEAALRNCYAIGRDSGATWMVTVDGDVLPRAGAVRALLAEAERTPSNVAQVEGLVLDRVWGGFRHAGNRAYRTRFLDTLTGLVPGDGSALRPETAALDRLAAQGHPSRECLAVFGVHDHEQFLCDLYRKAFLQGQKFPDWVRERLPAWKASGEPDDLIVARGYCDGYLSPVAATVDARVHSERARAALASLGLEERAPLRIPEDMESIERRLLAVLPARLRAHPDSRAAKAAALYRRLGALRLVPHIVGGAIAMAGRGLQRIVSRQA